MVYLWPATKMRSNYYGPEPPTDPIIHANKNFLYVGKENSFSTFGINKTVYSVLLPYTLSIKTFFFIVHVKLWTGFLRINDSLF